MFWRKRMKIKDLFKDGIVVIGLVVLPGCLEKKEQDYKEVVVSTNPALQDADLAYSFFDTYLSCNTNVLGIRSYLDSKQVMTIVDVRDADSYKEGHIPTAINMPFSTYQSFEGDETEFSQLKKDRFTYVYCYEEFCNLAHRAARKFSFLGYPTKVIRGGFESWQKRGYKVER